MTSQRPAAVPAWATAPTGDLEAGVLGHVVWINPPLPLPRFWTPWRCLCGRGGTGADETGARAQFAAHVAAVVRGEAS